MGFRRLADPLVTRMYAKDVRTNLTKLKELVEAQYPLERARVSSARDRSETREYPQVLDAHA